MPGAEKGSTAGKPGGKFEELKEMMKSFLKYETARFKREERRLRNMEQPFSRIQEQVSLMKEKDDSKGSTGTNSDAEAAQILAENRRLMREQKEKEEQLRRGRCSSTGGGASENGREGPSGERARHAAEPAGAPGEEESDPEEEEREASFRLHAPP
ncbi:Reticulocyte-binding protein 2 like a [Dissostichus eleginoides]|uniref:Reticulocyte-binding protein 2 like a n=1 Tax=Dissostichus eleginoides TaxID=100907 RepID=A0AAD9CDS4_DISEL|nr:Reticulocyte-binding protein 2 like a [Dissostichus eleginoides]